MRLMRHRDTARAAIIALIACGLALSGAAAASSSPRRTTLPITVTPNIGTLAYTFGAALSPDGKLVATLDDGLSATSVKLWDIASGRPLRTFEHVAFFTAVAFTPDGSSIVSAHKDGKIKFWDVAAGATIATLSAGSPHKADESPHAVTAMWLDPAGELLVSGDDAGVATVWNMAQRRPVATFAIDKETRILSARLSADRTTLIAATRSLVKTVDLRTGTVTATFMLPKDHVFFADSIVGDSHFIALRLDPSCEIGELVQVSLDRSGDMASVDKPQPCNRPADGDAADHDYGEPRIFPVPGEPHIILARHGIPELKRWDLRTRTVAATIRWPQDASASVIAIGRDLDLAVARGADSIRIHRFATGELVREFSGTEYPAERAVASDNGRHLLLLHPPSPGSPGRRDIHLWNVDAGKPTTTSLSTGETIAVYDLANDGKTALAANEAGEIILFDTASGREQRRFSLPKIKEISDLRLSPGGKLIALRGEDQEEKHVVMLVDAEDGTIRLSLVGRSEQEREKDNADPDHVTSIAFSPDGTRLAAGRWNGSAEIWSTDPPRRIKLLPAEKEAEQTVSLAFSPDGRFLLGGSRDNGVYLWAVATGRLVRTFTHDTLAGHVSMASVALSHDGKLVAGALAERARSSGDIGAERRILVWDAATGKLRFSLRGHRHGVRAVTFSPDDRWIISASHDGTIRYWDRINGRWAATFASTRDGRWMVITERGFFAGFGDVDDLINVVRGLQAFPVRPFRDRLDRPDLVEQLLKGDPAHRYRDAASRLDLEKILPSAGK
jgi:WD40 repeat protein